MIAIRSTRSRTTDLSPRIIATVLAVALAALPVSYVAAAPAPDAIRSTTLANGMKVIVWTDRDIPNVALYNWVRVGSRNEAPGITGLAHFFEHMMFNGTSRRPPGAFDREMEAQGGSNNAYTSQDVTVYQDWFPRSALELVFDLEADRLANLAFDPKVIESERGVVFSERRFRVDDNNESFLMEQVQATAFVAHPYQIPTIGWPADIRSWRMQDLQSFFRTYYAPNNCTIVIAGDVSAEEIFALAKKHLEPIPRRELSLPPITREPQQVGERRLVVHRRGQTPLLQMAYKAPAAADERREAVDLLRSILAGGDASRLHRRLVEEKKLAISVGAYWHEGFDPGLFWIFVTLPEGGDVAAVEKAIDEELARVREQGVTAAELQRAKNLDASAYWRALSTINGKANLLGQFEVMQGDYQRLFEHPARVERVTAAQVQDAARLVLDARRRTVGVLLPQERVTPSEGEGDDGAQP